MIHIDRKSSFSPVASQSFSTTICPLVLQKRAGVYNVCIQSNVMSKRCSPVCRHRKKREAKIKRDVKRGIREPNEQNPFEIFVTVTDIRYTYVHFVVLPTSLLMCLIDTTKNHIKFLVTRMGCVSCKTLRPSRRIYLLGRLRRWRAVDLLCYC